MHSVFRKSLALLVLVLAISMATTTTLADGGGHLWFYSKDPDDLPGPQPLPNPQDYDPNYLGTDPDPWLTESIVVPSSEWETPFSIWLGCAQFESLGTKLVVSINDDASDVIESIKVGVVSKDVEDDFDTSGVPPGPLAPHGVFNSAEFYGCAEYDVGDLYSPPGSPYKVGIVVDITLKAGVTEVPENAKIHFDAYGLTERERWIRNPYSHDFTFVIPEIGTIFLAAASFSALALYALKRRKYLP